MIHVTVGSDFKLDEFSSVGQLVTENLSPDANVIIGARINKDFGGKVRVITIMTGVKSPYVLGRYREPMPSAKSEMSDLGIEVFR